MSLDLPIPNLGPALPVLGISATLDVEPVGWFGYLSIRTEEGGVYVVRVEQDSNTMDPNKEFSRTLLPCTAIQQGRDLGCLAPAPTMLLSE